MARQRTSNTPSCNHGMLEFWNAYSQPCSTVTGSQRIQSRNCSPVIAENFETINLKPFKLFVLVDEKNRDLTDGHMIMWRIFNNTDAQRDLYREGDRALFDATYKLPERLQERMAT